MESSRAQGAIKIRSSLSLNTPSLFELRRVGLTHVAADVSPRTSFRRPDQRRLTSAATGHAPNSRPALSLDGFVARGLPRVEAAVEVEDGFEAQGVEHGRRTGATNSKVAVHEHR